MSTKEPIDLSQFDGHTPGPWFVEYGCGRESGTVYEICAGTREVSTRLVETDAGVYHLDPRDAELMAAAPELLAELRERRQRDGELLAALDEFESLMRAWHSQKDDIAFIQYMTVNAPDFDAAIANAVKASAK